MNDYQKEQLETLEAINNQLLHLSAGEKQALLDLSSDYLAFRKDTAGFLDRHFGETCTRNCYENRVSACCSKDGIITFFADVLINALLSSPEEIDALIRAIRHPRTAFKCIYLGEQGCLWHLKPIVCEMFLCDTAADAVFKTNASARDTWNSLEEKKKSYTWPDHPILFDDLEKYFINMGIRSPLMYINYSPGLLRVRELAVKKGSYNK